MQVDNDEFQAPRRQINTFTKLPLRRGNQLQDKRPMTTKSNTKKASSTWIKDQHPVGEPTAKAQPRRGQDQFGRTHQGGSAEPVWWPPWPTFLWRFAHRLWRSVPRALNATDLRNRLQEPTFQAYIRRGTPPILNTHNNTRIILSSH